MAILVCLFHRHITVGLTRSWRLPISCEVIYIVMLIPVQALSTTTNSLVSNLIGAGGITHVMRLIWRIARMSFPLWWSVWRWWCFFLMPCFRFTRNEPALLVEVCAFVVCHCRSDDYCISGEYLFQCHFGNWKYAGCSDT